MWTMKSNLRKAAPLVLVGAGKMGGAMLMGWLDQGLSARDVFVIDPSPPPEMFDVASELGVFLGPTAPEGIQAAVLVLAVKPQILESVLPGLLALITDSTVTVSIAAGKTLANLEAGLGPSAIVRAMPNTPAQVGRGISVAIGNDKVTPMQRALVTALLAAVGNVEWVAQEGLMDAVTAVSGSGPAYVFLLAECLAEAGRKAGLPADLALTLARSTVEGAGELLYRSPLDPATLRRNVTSPNGTTAAALDVLMAENGLQVLLEQAIDAATQRSRALAT